MADDVSFEEKPKWVQMTCEICDQTFWVPPSRATKKRWKKHCNRKCSDEALGQRMMNVFGKDHPCFRNGWFVDKFGYKQVLVSSPKEVKGGHRYKGEHVLIAEGALGRPLKHGECVHHIDDNRLNNEKSNLLICDRGYHTWLHWEMSRRYAQAVFGEVRHR